MSVLEGGVWVYKRTRRGVRAVSVLGVSGLSAY